MPIADMLLLGINLTLACIFLALIALCIVIWRTGTHFKTESAARVSEAARVKPDPAVLVDGGLQVDKSGMVSGEAVVSGADEETVAAIIAAISYHLDTPLGNLRIRSIKAV